MFNTVKDTVIPIFVVKIVKSHELNFRMYILPAGNRIRVLVILRVNI